MSDEDSAELGAAIRDMARQQLENGLREFGLTPVPGEDPAVTLARASGASVEFLNGLAARVANMRAGIDPGTGIAPEGPPVSAPVPGPVTPARAATPPTPQPRRVNTVDFDRAMAEANRRAEERERPQGDAPDVDMSDLTPGEWVRVREEANIIAAHLKGKSGRVCENQHTIHQSMSDNERWVTLWFPCEPDTTHRIRKTALIGRGNIPDCTCNDIGHSPLHEDQCETAVFHTSFPYTMDAHQTDQTRADALARAKAIADSLTPSPPKRRKWGV